MPHGVAVIGQNLRARYAAPTAGAVGLFALLVVAGLLYTNTGGQSREGLVTETLINVIIVVGIQIYIGNTGILSFGHVGFAGIAAYTFALLAIDPDSKERFIPEAPFGLTDFTIGAGWALLAAMAFSVLIAFVVGLGLARSGAQSGAVAATVITLGLLFVVHEVASNWPELTGGSRGGLSFGIGDNLRTRGWVYLATIAALLTARWFRASDRGRLAQAAREDDLAARAVGIDPAVQQMLALLLSVAVIAVGAALRVFTLGSVSPRFFFFDFTLITLTMLIVGGRNSVTGAVLGVVTITVGSEVTRYLSGPDVDIGVLDWVLREGLTRIFLGGAMLGFMLYRSRGLLDDWELDDWLAERFPRLRAMPSATPLDPQSSPASAETLTSSLSAGEVTVDFGGFRALDAAYLEAPADRIVGLIGPNGAGKTTLINVMTGIVPATGNLTLTTDGRRRELLGEATHEIARQGLVRTFQNLRLFPALSVRENVAIAAVSASRYRSHRPPVDVDAVLEACGLVELRDRRARQLDYGNARRLELARAAAARPEFLLLDEPTSGMSDRESEEMIERVRGVADLVGAGVVVIDHDLGFITGICDQIYCLDQGRVIATGSPDEIQANPIVQAAYLGTAAPA